MAHAENHASTAEDEKRGNKHHRGGSTKEKSNGDDCAADHKQH
jgi:hypothetical protein